MKKIYYLLSGIMVLFVTPSVDASGYVGEITKAKTMADVYAETLRQAELVRPSTYKELDELVSEGNWDRVFNFLDSKKGTISAINVNKYRRSGLTLLGSMVNQANVLVVRRLLEIYKADPNVPVEIGERMGTVHWKTALQEACTTPLRRFAKEDCLLIIKLLLERGANPYFKDEKGSNSFDMAQKSFPAALEILNKYKK